MKRESVGRPKTRLFTFLSIIWLFVFIPASAPFWLGDSVLSFSGMKLLCILVMLPEPVFVLLAVVYAVREQSQNITEHIPNPDHDIRKLY